MERFNVQIPPEEDFPQVIRAQRIGEDFQTEYVEYVPRWNVDKYKQAVIVDKRMFFALTAAVDRLQEYGAKLTNLAKQMYPLAKAHLQLGVALGCNDTLSYDWALQMTELGIEVPE